MGDKNQYTTDFIEEMDMEAMDANEPEITDTIKETDKKCDACGGTMDFNPSKGNLVCPYCGSEKVIQVNNPKFEAKELDFNRAEAQGSCDWGTATKTVICKSCGAKTVYDVNQIANECPYCGSNQVMEAGDEDVMAPGGVVLFKLDAKAASVRFKHWIGGKFFCPKLAKDSARPKAFKGMYVPFWTFDTQTLSKYSGQYGIDRTVQVDGKAVVKTSWHSTRGQLSYSIDDMLVCASSKQNEAMLKEVEPYNTKDVAEYKPEYLAGFMAERYTVNMKDAWETAKNRISQILRDEVKQKIKRERHADHVGSINIQTTHRNITYKYLLLPVWISSFQYNGKVYHFMVNGQTGKVSGQTPISWVKVAFTVVAVFVILAILMRLTTI